MQSYNFTFIEKKWQKIWEAQKNNVHQKEEETDKKPPTYYILNMFPYPSGAGLHVGHYMGYVASDILARYHRHLGCHVLNPMGFDSFGLPAEQYAIQTGQHPAVTTAKNAAIYQAQFQQIGLDFDWDRSFNTSDPSYYKWTQWIFLQFFNTWYNTVTQKAEPIDALMCLFERQGNEHIQAACDEDVCMFSAKAWRAFSESEKQAKLLQYRLAYLKDSMVNWCEALGTVLANEEIKDGFSERGGHPVVRKQMKQWHLRMTAYADRLLTGLDALDWPLPTKEMQRNWIGRSEGAEITFRVQGQPGQTITVFTTRPETIFGACFIVLAPEHPWAHYMAAATEDETLIDYIEKAKNQTDRSRIAASSFLGGAFVGACVIHPFTGAPLPIWVADYVLPTYGTGAIMGVPAHDSRDYLFAQTFELLILPVIKNNGSLEEGPYEGKEGIMINSSFLTGLSVPVAFQRILEEITKKQIGKYKVHYKLHDPIFSRQRYWGEPFPICYKTDGLPQPLSPDQLPLTLPEVSSYQPNKSGKPPLSNALCWTSPEGYPLELFTMPGWAGSSWYFLRYMDPHNQNSLVGKEKEAYWQTVDYYIGGSEHATGHLLYARFWTKFLHDLGCISMQEPFPKVFHQGMIQNFSALVYRVNDTNTFVSLHLKDIYHATALHVPITMAPNHILDIEAFKKWRPEFANATFLLEDGKYICGSKLEKMSKSKHNVINPDAIIAQYGADALRLYLMFLGPLEQSKPWDVSGIEGTARFLQKVWHLVHHAQEGWANPTVDDSKEVLKALHQAIKQVTEAIQRNSFNTAVSSLMICLNKLSTHETISKDAVQKFILLLEPFAPYLAAELWEKIGDTRCIRSVAFPEWEETHLTETCFVYPIAVNGKVRAKCTFDVHASDLLIEETVLAHPGIQKWIGEKKPNKVLIIRNKMINIVVP